MASVSSPQHLIKVARHPGEQRFHEALCDGYQVPFAEQIRAEAILQQGQANLVALAREILYNPNWPMDAAPYALVPSAQEYCLAKRKAEIVPSTYGMQAKSQ